MIKIINKLKLNKEKFQTIKITKKLPKNYQKNSTNKRINDEEKDVIQRREVVILENRKKYTCLSEGVKEKSHGISHAYPDFPRGYIRMDPTLSE